MEKTLDGHWEKIYLHQQKDFRSANLNRLLLKMMPRKGSVLDVGCGTCGLTLELLKYGYDVYAIDSSFTMVENAKKVLEKAGYSRGIVTLKNLLDLDENDKFDIIICLDVLEHIEDDYHAFGKLSSSLNKGAKIIISVPAMQSLYGKRDVELGHYRRYDPNQLTSIFNKYNIEIEKLRYWNFIGILPLFISNKKDKRLNEEFRYSASFKNRSINKFLYYWFRFFENNVDAKIGLTLICLGIKS